MANSSKKIIVLVEQQYQELEVWYPYYRLKEAGYSAYLVGPEKGVVYPSKLGYPAKSELAASEVNADDFAGIVIPGGFAPDYIRRSEAMLKIVRDLAAQKKVIAAICHGPWVLCSTTALRGKKATCFFAIKDDVINAGAEYLDAETVVDGNLITARKPDDIPAFCTALLKALS